MKSLVQAALIAAVLAAPAISFAQSNAPVTRAQVQADLVQFEQAAGPRAFGRDPYYPASTQATEASIAAHNGATATTAAYGGAAGGVSASGQRVAASPTDSVYFGR